MKLSLPQKLVEILVWVSVISLYKTFIPSFAFVFVVSEHFE
jgi:hypothetical protein